MPRISVAALIAAICLASGPAFAQASFEGEDSVTSANGGTVIRTWHRLRDATHRRHENLQRPSWTVRKPGRPDSAVRVERVQLPMRQDPTGRRQGRGALEQPRVLDRPHVLDLPRVGSRRN